MNPSHARINAALGIRARFLLRFAPTLGAYCDDIGGELLQREATWIDTAHLLRFDRIPELENCKLTNTHRIEMNVIIIAACIPTLRPLCLVIFKRPDGDAYRLSATKYKHSSYQKTPDSNDSSQSKSIISD